jgi:hypothetical protein
MTRFFLCVLLSVSSTALASPNTKVFSWKTMPKLFFEGYGLGSWIQEFRCGEVMTGPEISSTCKVACNSQNKKSPVYNTAALGGPQTEEDYAYDRCYASCGFRIREVCAAEWTEVASISELNSVRAALEATQGYVGDQIIQESEKALKNAKIVEKTKDAIQPEIKKLTAELEKLREEFEEFKINGTPKPAIPPKAKK